MLSPERIASWSPAHRDALAEALRARAEKVAALAAKYDQLAYDWVARPGRLTGVGVGRDVDQEFDSTHADIRRAFERVAELTEQYVDELRALAKRVQADL
jgi:uncharacterized protein YukE